MRFHKPPRSSRFPLPTVQYSRGDASIADACKAEPPGLTAVAYVHTGELFKEGVKK